MNDPITGEPERLYCKICGDYIPHGQAADILGQDVCSDCEKQITGEWPVTNDEPPARITCPDCGADIVNDGGCWYCENKPE